MKKIFSFIALACMSCLSISAQTVAQCMLMHGESATLYGNEKIQEAIDNAEAGDVIQLTEGSFPGFTLNKDVQIKGAGQNTVIRDGVNIEIPDNPTLSRVLLSGFYCNSDISINSEMTGFQVSKVCVYSINVNASNVNTFFEKCFVRNYFNINSNWTNCNVINSKINIVYSWNVCYEPVVTFTNCNVRGMDCPGYSLGNYYRCIVRYRSWTSSPEHTNFVQTLYNGGSLGSESSEIGCWDVAFDFDDELNFPYTTEEMISNGWVDDDGNVIGIYGGNNPYTLVPSGPKVTESKLTVDPVEKKLKVNLKVTAN